MPSKGLLFCSAGHTDSTRPQGSKACTIHAMIDNRCLWRKRSICMAADSSFHEEYCRSDPVAGIRITTRSLNINVSVVQATLAAQPLDRTNSISQQTRRSKILSAHKVIFVFQLCLKMTEKDQKSRNRPLP